MLTKAVVLEAIKGGKESDCIDRRDFSRLSGFFPVSQWPIFGFTLVDGAKAPKVTTWTRRNILSQLKSDVEFGFEKALNKRGISASCMHCCVKLWLWILEDPLQHDTNYAQYGLPLFKKVAMKYGFDNRIGNDAGNERKYADR